MHHQQIAYTAVPTSEFESASSSLTSSPLLHPQHLHSRTELSEKSPRSRPGWLKHALILTSCVLFVCLTMLIGYSLGGGSFIPKHRPEDDILLITKTGSATLHTRLPIHLLHQSDLYIPNRLFVSDYPTTLNGIEFFDALGNVSEIIASLDEFSRLRSQLHSLMQSNQDLSLMDSEGGWKLDKYKFLPTFAEAWRRFPQVKWVVMVEADTFLFWQQLVRWLGSLDPSKQLLLGHGTWTDYNGTSTMFAHGGSGIVVSRGLMEATFGDDPEFEHNHDALIQASAFGDGLLSKALYDSSNLTELSKEGGQRFNSDPPRVLKFTKEVWCQPLLTMHHVSNIEVARLYDFQRRKAGEEVRWKDMYEEFQPAFLKSGEDSVEKRGWSSFEEWDSETTDLVTGSAEECKAHCRAMEGCLMWEWRKQDGSRPKEQIWANEGKKVYRRGSGGAWGKCRFTSDFLRIGEFKPKSKGLVTGWMTGRIDTWKARACSET